MATERRSLALGFAGGLMAVLTIILVWACYQEAVNQVQKFEENCKFVEYWTEQDLIDKNLRKEVEDGLTLYYEVKLLQTERKCFPKPSFKYTVIKSVYGFGGRDEFEFSYWFTDDKMCRYEKKVPNPYFCTQVSSQERTDKENENINLVLTKYFRNVETEDIER